MISMLTQAQFIAFHRGARRIWFWRYSGLFLTIFFCMFCGGILIEVVQAALPVSSIFNCAHILTSLQFKVFEWGDIAVRFSQLIRHRIYLTVLLGQHLGLNIRHLDGIQSGAVLPIQARGSCSQASLYVYTIFTIMQLSRLYQPLSATTPEYEDDGDEENEFQLLPTHHKKGKTRLTDVWDEREELFGVGEDSDEENGREQNSNLSNVHAPRIVISHS